MAKLTRENFEKATIEDLEKFIRADNSNAMDRAMLNSRPKPDTTQASKSSNSGGYDDEEPATPEQKEEEYKRDLETYRANLIARVNKSPTLLREHEDELRPLEAQIDEQKKIYSELNANISTLTTENNKLKKTLENDTPTIAQLKTNAKEIESLSTKIAQQPEKPQDAADQPKGDLLSEIQAGIKLKKRKH